MSKRWYPSLAQHVHPEVDNAIRRAFDLLYQLKDGVSTAATTTTTGGVGLPIKESDVINLVADLGGKVSASRKILTALPLIGGGDLSTDRTHGINDFTGDSGAGGTNGAVPAPPSMSAAAGKFLKADGTWAVPSTSVGSVGWGAITGTLSAQTDLWTKLLTIPTLPIAESDVTGLVADLAACEKLVNKDQPNGYPSLDATGKVPVSELPSMGGSGTVTSVALTMPPEFAVSGSPITTSGILAVAKNTQVANAVYAGPATGSAAAPTFRALVAADLPTIGGGGGGGGLFQWGGDGADGAVLLDGTNTYSGLVTTTGAAPNLVYTLARDMYATTLTLASGVTLNTSCWRIFASVSVTINGHVACDGSNGANASGTTGQTTAATTPAQSATGTHFKPMTVAGTGAGNGKTGGTTSGTAGGGGSTGTSVLKCLAAAGAGKGADSGKGGNGASGSGGVKGTGGAQGTHSKSTTRPVIVCEALALRNFDTSGSTTNALANWEVAAISGGAASGAGGGGDTTNSGGQGGGAGEAGGNGGPLLICSPSITVSATGSITATGGNGGNGGDGQTPTLGNTGGGGGGGGGNAGHGGIIVLIHQTYSNAGTVAAAAGTPGTHGAGGNGHGSGTAGDPGQDGTAGVTGYVIQIGC